MEFARSQLEKHGWSEGKGLGRQETGMKDAIKVKLKFDTAGVGHNAADQFTYHWWSHAFDKAAKNINVNQTEEGVSVEMEDTQPLSTRKPLSKAMANKAMLYGRFIKSATLHDGRLEKESTSSSSDSEEEDSEDESDKIKQVTDEDLFKLCGGRTAHKGARHGLTASAKLSRIQEQEAAFMAKWATPKDPDSSKASKIDQKSELTSEISTPDQSHSEKSTKKHKKKKSKKRKNGEEESSTSSGYSSDTNKNNVIEELDVKKHKKKKKRKDKEVEEQEETQIIAESDKSEVSRKKKKKHKNKERDVDENEPNVEVFETKKPKTKKNKGKEDKDKVDHSEENISNTENKPKKKRKHKQLENSLEETIDKGTTELEEIREPKKKKHKK